MSLYERTSQEKIIDCYDDFIEQSNKLKRHRSDIEDQQLLQRIDGILDEFWEVTVEHFYEDKSSE